MTANQDRPKRTKPTIILPPETPGADHPPRPFYCSWYRIVFDPPANPGGAGQKPPVPRPE
ncbi:MAG: hypothetical protein R2864_11795 [Syntrophotaleaceae bacterium]